MSDSSNLRYLFIFKHIAAGGLQPIHKIWFPQHLGANTCWICELWALRSSFSACNCCALACHFCAVRSKLCMRRRSRVVSGVRARPRGDTEANNRFTYNQGDAHLICWYAFPPIVAKWTRPKFKTSVFILLSPPVHFARWAHMRHFLSVCPYGLDQKSDLIIIQTG